MCLWRSLCTLYVLACQARAAVGDPGLCCCVVWRPFERYEFLLLILGGSTSKTAPALNYEGERYGIVVKATDSRSRGYEDEPKFSQ